MDGHVGPSARTSSAPLDYGAHRHAQRIACAFAEAPHRCGFRDELPDVKVRTSDEFGLPAEAKEAVAFAVLAYQTWRRVPSNIPAATGAERAVILGKISYP
ncbi:MAG: anhydro-N-acetylmuramic acid kinase [Acidobacteriia bacterium]|nr:anhydro-N-acetylmuramic acid kinase [Terriglobia bacterium]